jgi:hypothetical protein
VLYMLQVLVEFASHTISIFQSVVHFLPLYKASCLAMES